MFIGAHAVSQREKKEEANHLKTGKSLTAHTYYYIVDVKQVTPPYNTMRCNAECGSK